MFPDQARMYVLRVRHGGTVEDATSELVLQSGDVVSVVGPREEVMKLVGRASPEVDDPELLSADDRRRRRLYYEQRCRRQDARRARKVARRARRLHSQHQARPHRDADPSACRHEDLPRRRDADHRTHGRYDRRRKEARYHRSADRRRRHCVHRSRDHARRVDRCDRHQDRRRSDHALDRGRRADLRHRLWMVPRDATDVRPDSFGDRVVHELVRPQRIYRRGRLSPRVRSSSPGCNSSESACSSGAVWPRRSR